MQKKMLIKLIILASLILILLCMPISCSGGKQSGGPNLMPEDRLNALKNTALPGDIIFGQSSMPGHVGVVGPTGIIIEANNVRENHLAFTKVSIDDFVGRNYKEVSLLRVNELGWGDRIASQAEAIADARLNTATYTYDYANKQKWDSDDNWYCSEFAYKSCLRAGFDLFPGERHWYCAFKRDGGEYPYLDKCPWWLITPGDVYFSKRLVPIFEWDYDPSTTKYLLTTTAGSQYR